MNGAIVFLVITILIVIGFIISLVFAKLLELKKDKAIIICVILWGLAYIFILLINNKNITENPYTNYLNF